MPMNPSLKQQWLEALRSGHYAQGRRALKKETKDGVCYCCLGVLAEVAGLPSHPVTRSEDIPAGAPATEEQVYMYEMPIADGRRAITMLPQSWLTGIGLDYGLTGTLVDRNDGYRWGFEQIASMIEDEA